MSRFGTCTVSCLLAIAQGAALAADPLPRVAVRVEPGIAATNGSVGDYTWNGANGTSYWADPREQLVVVTMTAGPGEIRKYYREQMAALVYGAMEK